MAMMNDLYNAMLRDSGVPASSLDPLQPHVASNAAIFRSYAENIRDLRKKLDDKLDQDIATLLRQSNALLPIMRLPSEILLKIFETCLGSPPTANFYTFKVKLMGVCFRWFTLGRTAPSLWSFITNQRSETSVAEALARSGNAPLFVEFHTHTGSHPSKFSHASFCALLKDNIQRLQCARIWMDPKVASESEMRQLLAVSAPQLETLQLVSMGHWPETHLVDFFQPSVRLRELILERTSISWGTSSLRNLTSLKVDRVTARETAIDDVFAVIRASPCLTTIDFNDFSIVPGEIKSVSTHLPFLTNVCLQFINTTSIDQLVEGLDAPNCRDIALKSRPHCRNASNLFKSLPKWVSYSFTELAAGSSILIEFADKMASITICTAGALNYDGLKNHQKLDMKLSVGSHVDVIECLVGLSVNTAASIAISLRQVKVDQPDFIASLLRISSLTSIDLHTWEPLEAFLTTLATRQKSSGSKSKWHFPFPNLETLVFDSTCVEANRLTQMIRLRYGQEKKITAAPIKKREPRKQYVDKPLQLIIHETGITDMTEEVVEELQVILGEENVIWDVPEEEDSDDDDDLHYDLYGEYSDDEDMDDWGYPY